MPKKFLFILFLGLLLRFLFIGNTGFLADISFWKSWSLAAADHGVVWAALNTNTNYPPAFLYILWLMGKMYSLIANPHNFNDFWRQNNFAFLLVSKSIAIISDAAIACLIYWFFSQKETLKKLGAFVDSGKIRPTTLPLLLSSVFFLNPVVILDSAIWGQVESFGILFTLAAIILLFYKKPLLATAIFTIGTMMKLQNIIFIPIFFLFIWRYFDLATMVKSVAAAAAAFLFLNLPFIWEHQMNQVMYLLTVNSDYFPWLSLNAHNLWWIVANGHGMPSTDKITLLGILNAKTLGLLLFSGFYLLSSLLVFQKPSPRNFILSLTLAIFAFFLFTTQSHERYSYPVIVLLLFLYPFIENKTLDFIKGWREPGALLARIPKVHGSTNRVASDRTPKLEYFWIIYALLTLAIFFNMHYGLIINYPDNGLRILTQLTTTPLTILNSYFLILLFFLLLPFIFSQISILFLGIISMFLGLSLIILNLGYLMGNPISLTSFKPVLIKQDFGTLQTNKSVNSYPGWKSWNRLSNNYFFYRRGFGTHANSNIVFDIDKKFRRFTTDFGVDTEAATPASVTFIIYGDTKKLFSTGKMGRFDFPKHAEVDVTGVKYLGLMVTDAGDGINSDHADWFNPVLFK